jgi:deoxyadenosine/deoxycytidine kinase
MSRIHKRAIDAEQVIEAEYLDQLRERYYALWNRYTASPVYVVDTSRLHYVDDMSDRATMLQLIDGWLNGEPVAGAPKAYQSPTRQVAMF